MWFILLFLALGCNKKPMTLTTARLAFADTTDCIELLKIHMEAAGCEQLNYTHLSEFDMMFRCNMPDDQRDEFWANYVFRISPVSTRYESIEDRTLIEKHTICVGAATRLEAYPPTMIPSVKENKK